MVAKGEILGAFAKLQGPAIQFTERSTPLLTAPSRDDKKVLPVCLAEN